MNVSEFLKATDVAERIAIRPVIICRDGFAISVQASFVHQSQRCKNSHEYGTVEIATNKMESKLEPFKTEYQNIFGYVPIEFVDDIIDKHGGMDVDMTFHTIIKSNNLRFIEHKRRYKGMMI